MLNNLTMLASLLVIGLVHFTAANSVSAYPSFAEMP